MFTSLQSRLSLIAFVAMLVALAVGAVLFVGVLQRTLLAEIDQSIINRAIDVSIEIDITNELDNTSFPSDPETFVGVIEDPSGQPILDIHNDDAPDVAQLLDVFASIEGEIDVPVDASIDSITLTEGADNLRLVFTSVDTGDELVAVARTLDGVDRTLSNVRTILIVAVPLIAGLVAVLVYVLAGRALRPVEAIRSQVDGITAGDLTERVPVPIGSAGHNEISRLAMTMNKMLGRLEKSHNEQRRFTSDAAHELRTPLASMRTQLEVDLAHPEQADWPATASQVHGDVERMQRLVEDLLRLARADDANSSTKELRRELIDLDDIVLAELGSLVRREGVRVETSAVSAASVRASSDELRRLVANLLANAMRHAESTVAITLGETAEGSVLRVDDDGSGVASPDRERIFERFVRLDEARSRDAGGAGLGLALSREIAHAHDGTLTVETSELGGASFVLRLPAPA